MRYTPTIASGLITVGILISIAILGASDATPSRQNQTEQVKQEQDRIHKLLMDSAALRRSPEHRKKEMQHVATITFGPIIDEFETNAGTMQHLLDTLTERGLCAYDTQDALSASNITNMSDRRKAIIAAQAGLDSEILKKYTDERADLMRKALASDFYLAIVNLNDATECANMGHPLTAKQRISLAWEMYQAFDTEQNPKAKDRFKLPINALSLTELEETLLSNLNGILDQEQLFIVRNRLMAVQMSVRKP